jgi:hypothetical protein
MKPNPAFAQVFDHRIPVTDGVVSAARAGAHAGESLAEGEVPGLTNDGPALKGISRGVGSAASGIGEGIGSVASAVGSVAKGAGEAVEGVGHAVKRVASLGEGSDEGETREARAQENENAEEQKEVTSTQRGEIRQPNAEVTDGHLRNRAMHQSAYSVNDSGLSWGRAGQVEATKERGQPQMPAGAASATGFGNVQSASTVTPDPVTLGRPLMPDSPSGSEGNWNAADIFANTRIG